MPSASGFIPPFHPVHTWVETRMKHVSQHADQPRVRLSQVTRVGQRLRNEASQSLPQAPTRSSILSYKQLAFGFYTSCCQAVVNFTVGIGVRHHEEIEALDGRLAFGGIWSHLTSGSTDPSANMLGTRKERSTFLYSCCSLASHRTR